MSINENSKIEIPLPVDTPLSMRDLAAILVKHYGIHEGRYDLLIEFQIGTGTFGPSPDTRTPGAMIGLSKVGLVPTRVNGPTTVDAAVVNPRKKISKKTKQ